MMSNFFEDFKYPDVSHISDSVEPNSATWLIDLHKDGIRKVCNSDTALIMELGVWLGGSSRFMLEICPKSKVIAVDTWIGSIEHHQDPTWKDLLPKLFDTFLVTNHTYADRLFPVRGDSVEVMKLIAEKYPEIQPDVIHIDGDHSYGGVYRDFETALMLFPNSRIVGDDYNGPDVKRAVDAVASKYGLTISNNPRVWWVVK